jgi:hypothetical protein
MLATAGNLWYMGTRTGGAMTEEHLTGVTPGEYKFTVRLPAEMRDRLRKMAELAEALGLIPKADLADLTNLALTLASET